MRFGRIGGALLVGGCLLLVVVGAIALAGGSVGIGSHDAGGWVLAAALALDGAGAAILGVAGGRPLDGRAVRIGLGMLGIGLGSLMSAAVMAGASGYDPLESGPLVILFLVGLPATAIGSVVTVLALVRKPGRPRAVGSLFLGGLLLAVLAGLLANAIVANTALDAPQLHVLTGAMALVGGAAMVIAWAGVGVLAIDGGRSALVATP